jgi:ribosomal protein S17
MIMTRVWHGTVAALLLTTASLLAADEKTKDEAPSEVDATAQDVAALARGREVLGVVVSADASSKTVVFRVEYQEAKLDVNPMTGKTSVKNVKAHKDFEIQATAEAKVRLADLPPRVDKDGKPQPYTAKEKQELKGADSSLTGYHADFDTLTPGKIIKVTIDHSKPLEKDALKVPVKFILIEGEGPAPMPDVKKDKKDK